MSARTGGNASAGNDGSVVTARNGMGGSAKIGTPCTLMKSLMLYPAAMWSAASLPTFGSKMATAWTCPISES